MKNDNSLHEQLIRLKCSQIKTFFEEYRPDKWGSCSAQDDSSLGSQEVEMLAILLSKIANLSTYSPHSQ